LIKEFEELWEKVKKKGLSLSAYLCGSDEEEEEKRIKREEIRELLKDFLLKLQSQYELTKEEKLRKRIPLWEVHASILKIAKDELAYEEERPSWDIYREAFKAPLIRALLYNGLDNPDKYLKKLFKDNWEKVKKGIEEDLKILRERSGLKEKGGGDQEASS
jgi:hypothetical protein